MSITETTVAGLRERAIAAAERYRAEHEEALRKNAEENADRAVANLREVICEKFGIAETRVRWVTLWPGAEARPVAEADGIRFVLEDREYPYAVRILGNCTDCGQVDVSRRIDTLTELGLNLAEFAINQYHREHCPANVPPTATLPEPTPATEERLLAALRDFIRENQDGAE